MSIKQQTPLPVYVEGKETVRVSGGTDPKSAGRCAFVFFSKGLLPEFVCIGSNASHQATKSMHWLRYRITHNAPPLSVDVAFQPHRYQVMTKNPDTGVEMLKDVVVWKTVVINLSENAAS